MPSLFISYRRQDSGPITRRLAETLTRYFGDEHVFFDTESIRIGQEWPARITAALNHATVLLCVIGSQWLRICNEFGQRRIDVEGDWVREELVSAFDRGIPVLPILVSGATPLPPAALPERIWPLHAKQSYELKDEHWQRDVTPLVEQLIALGFVRSDSDAIAADIIYPPAVDRVKPLTSQELDAALARLPEWRLVKRHQPGGNRLQLSALAPVRTELYRTFRFTSFEDASHFMFAASRHASRHGHHPDWQNLWINVQVWLTTWDIGHRPSFKDVRLALYLDSLYEEYGLPPETKENF